MPLNSLLDRYYAARTIALTEGRLGKRDLTGSKIAPLLASCRGNILEIGAGGGAAIQYLNSAIAYTAVEPNPYLANAIKERAQEQGISSCTVIQSTAEQLPFADNTFDAAYSLRSFCSVNDLPKVLQEIKRVLKPGGICIFAEHVAAPHQSFRYWAQRIVSLFNPCDLARDIESAIRSAGFSDVHIESFTTGSRLRAVMALRIFGWARKAGPISNT